MSFREFIQGQIQKEFDPIHLDTVDESHCTICFKGSESYFKVIYPK